MKLIMITELQEYLPDQGHQYKYGDCSLAVYQMVKRAISNNVLDFIVVDSMVEINGTEFPHSWIEKDNKIVDPTVNQFGNSDIIYGPEGSYRDEFSPHEYIEYFEEQYGEV